MIDVKKIATLANLSITDSQVEQYKKQLGSILELFSKLQKINTTNVIPTSQVTGQTNVFREDKIESDRVLTQEQALSSTQKIKNGYFVVPKILE